MFGRRAINVPLILQNEISECGLACIAMVASAHGRQTSLPELRALFDPGSRGASLRDLAVVAEGLGFTAKSMKVGINQISKIELPAIVHWNLVHYVVLVESVGSTFVIHDPALGRREITMDEFSDSFTGLVQQITPNGSVRRKARGWPVKLSWLLEDYRGFWPTVGTIFAVSMVMQAFVMVVPFSIQLVLDQIANSGDILAFAVAAASGALGLLLYCTLMSLRASVILQLSNALDGNGSLKLMTKMFSLPYEFFAKRDTGSLLNRFANLRELRLLLSQGFAESFVEAILSVFILAALWIYIPWAAGTAVLSIAGYAGYRFAKRETQRDRLAEMFHNFGSQNGSLIESIQKIETVKANALENIRQEFWAARFGEYQNSVIRKVGIDQSIGVALTVLTGTAYISCGMLAAHSIQQGTLSLAEAMTSLVLLALFLARATVFVDRAFEMSVARVHLDALADVVNTASELTAESRAVQKSDREGWIELRNVGFRFSPSEPFVFRAINLSVERGAFVAISGPSGCGKSTLLSLLLGLRSPTEGEILVDGIPLDNLDIKRLRRMVGTVMQGDRLFYGSVQENVTCFELEVDQDRLNQSLQRAQIHGAVDRLPMKEHTMLSDSPLMSGGEVQRLLLARALYKQPRFLLLDEATSHLDEANEREVMSSLNSDSTTRIAIAHRRQTLDTADRVITLGFSAATGCTTIVNDTCQSPHFSAQKPHTADSSGMAAVDVPRPSCP